MALGSVAGKNLSLNCMYGANKAAIAPATVYGHLYLSDPTQGGVELASTGGYAAVSISNDGTNFPDASGGQMSNGAVWAFPESTGAWSGVATFFWLTDALGCAPPGPLTITQAGTAGSTAYSYQVTAVNAAGETTVSPTGTTFTGNATLSATNYNTISWAAVTGAVSYNVYKLVSGVFVLLANTASTSYNDEGASTSATNPPTVNTTANLLDGGPLTAPVIVTGAGVVVELAPGALVIGA